MGDIKLSNWGTRHSHAYNHLGYFLRKSLESTDGFLSLEEIRRLLKDETGFRFHPATLIKYNKKYAEKYGMGPLCQFGDVYKLNRCFYEMIQLKPPREYKKRHS